jgi:N4-(beta-N-acetylglucosaminyl)-L-asparaginase
MASTTRKRVPRRGEAALRPVVISSANGARPPAGNSKNGPDCCLRAMQILKEGGSPLDAVVAGVTIVEDDPTDTSVGYGGLPDAEGVVELDASVMDGASRRAGAVAALRDVKNAAQVARLVMERTDHILLVSEGARRFAIEYGFKPQDLLTEQARKAWLRWREELNPNDARGPSPHTPRPASPSARPPAPNTGGARSRQDPVSPPDLGAVGARSRQDPVSPPAGRGAGGPAGGHQARAHEDPEFERWVRQVIDHPPTGTINCLAVNGDGDLAGTTTTSGLAWKIPGRVGDSPLIGCGVYVDNEVGAAGSTGRGEECIFINGAHTVVEAMRRGASPTDAAMEAVRRVAARYGNNRDALKPIQIQFYALNKQGDHGAASLWKGTRYAVNDGSASRLLPCAFLLDR